MTTLLGAMTTSSVTAMMAIEAGTSTDGFESFLRDVLLPKLEPSMTVVMDNLGAHRAKRIAALLHEHGIKARFTPPYSPEYNPIQARCRALRRTARRPSNAPGRWRCRCRCNRSRRAPAADRRGRRQPAATGLKDAPLTFSLVIAWAMSCDTRTACCADAPSPKTSLVFTIAAFGFLTRRGKKPLVCGRYFTRPQLPQVCDGNPVTSMSTCSSTASCTTVFNAECFRSSTGRQPTPCG
ncbi:MAG: transposase [Deltaproteobacteria bacterium]|nr:transposase [Deltaproteobacteria bacterium]